MLNLSKPLNRITEEPFMKVSNWLVERGIDVFVEDGAFRTRSDNTRQDFAKIKAKTRPYNTGDRLGQVKKFEIRISKFNQKRVF